MWQNSKTQFFTKLKNSNCDETQIITKLKTQIVTKLKNSNGDKTQKLKFWEPKNWNCDKTQKLKMWRNLKTQIVTKQTQKLKLWQNSKTQIVTKPKKSNCDGSDSDSTEGSS